ncbi:MAG: hypothetical protein ABIH68_04930, partial [bacterium]
ITQGFIKIICFYPQIAFEILPPQKRLDVSIFAVDPARDIGGLRFPFDRGATACVSKWRKLDPSTVPVEAKAAANYLNGMVARLDAKRSRRPFQGYGGSVYKHPFKAYVDCRSCVRAGYFQTARYNT